MKIAFLHLTMGLAERGSEVSVDLLARAFSSSHQVLVLHSGKLTKSSYQTLRVYPLSQPPAAAPHHLLDKILFRLHLNVGAWQTIFFTLAALPHLRHFSPNIVIATNGAMQVRLLKLFLPNSKVVVFGRAGIGHDDLANLHAQPDLFIALSKLALDWAGKNKHASSVTAYIPNPIDVSLYKSAHKIKLNLTPPVVMVVSALSKYKNVDKVIEVAHRLGLSLLIIGDGEESDHISDLLRSYNGEFRWIKHINPSEIPSYYCAADVFCFIPDPQEAFGRVYLEAMAAGLPIVATDDAIRKSIVGAKGFYATPHNLENIGQAVKKALTHKKVNYSQELKEYDLKLITEKLIKLFNKLI